MRRVPASAWALIVASGVLQVVIFPIAGPVPEWRAALSWVCLVPFLLALCGEGVDGKPLKVRELAVMGYLCGILWYLGSCYWVMPTMYLYGGMNKAAAFGILLLFALYLGLYHALFAALFGAVRLWTPMQKAGALLAAPFLWAAVELARARITSFPWDQLGVAQVDNSVLTRLAPWAGIYAMSFVLVLVNALLAAAWIVTDPNRRRSTLLLGGGLAILIQTAGWLHWVDGPVVAPQARAVLLQPNLPESPEVQNASVAALAQQFAIMSERAAPSGNNLIVWPESPAPLQTNHPGFEEMVSRMARDKGSAVIAGALGMDPDADAPRGYRIYNSAALIGADGNAKGRYDKIHLVPFGEYLPYETVFSFAGGLVAEVGTFDRGRARTIFHENGHGYGVFICYESIFADEVRQFVKDGADVLVNISNDGWYGDTSAPWQHLAMARLRAIENRRWILRDTNTGVTGVIDPQGRLRESAPRHQMLAKTVGFGYERQITFYTRFGDLFAYACSLVTAAMLLWAAAGFLRGQPANLSSVAALK